MVIGRLRKLERPAGVAACRALRRHAAERGLPLAVVDAAYDESGRPLVKRDGMHLTPEGHAFVARRLEEHGIGPWMARILERRPG